MRHYVSFQTEISINFPPVSSYPMKSTTRQSLRAGAQKLQTAGVKSAWLDAALIVGFVLKKPKEYLFAHTEASATPRQRQKIQNLIFHRARGCPIAYLTNQKEFYGLNFFVDKNVLIPRPKTELLVEKALAIVAENFSGRTVNIADIGTGSGCIAVILANQAPNTRLFAVDVSARALSVAKHNAKNHGVSKKIKFYRGDLLTPIKHKRIDILVANLPYLRPSQIKGDIKFEPRRALVGGRNGLCFIKKLFQQITALKSPPRFVILEVDGDQIKTVKRLARKLLPITISCEIY